MPSLELETTHDIYQKLNQSREIVMSPQAGERAKELAWQRVDMLLDCLIDIGAIRQLVEVSTPGQTASDVV